MHTRLHTEGTKEHRSNHLSGIPLWSFVCSIVMMLSNLQLTYLNTCVCALRRQEIGSSVRRTIELPDISTAGHTIYLRMTTVYCLRAHSQQACKISIHSMYQSGSLAGITSVTVVTVYKSAQQQAAS
jgi:hypothetical protein